MAVILDRLAAGLAVAREELLESLLSQLKGHLAFFGCLCGNIAFF